MYLGRIVESARADELFANPRHPYTRALFSAIPVPQPHANGNGSFWKATSPARSRLPPAVICIRGAPTPPIAAGSSGLRLSTTRAGTQLRAIAGVNCLPSREPPDRTRQPPGLRR
jgi:ABC-type oligopeptide transport system, ATPase component